MFVQLQPSIITAFNDYFGDGCCWGRAIGQQDAPMKRLAPTLAAAVLLLVLLFCYALFSPRKLQPVARLGALLAAAGLPSHAAPAPAAQAPAAAAAATLPGRFTVLIISYDKRLVTLRALVPHYSRCPQVAEVVVVWNSGPLPVPDRDFRGAAAPVRVRTEAANSLNNRYRPDPLLATRAVFLVDDDVLFRCEDLAAGFVAWQAHPRHLVTFYPRLLGLQPPSYGHEPEVFAAGRYNVGLTGGAFLDAQRAFALYWSDTYAAARALVDELVNCEDILLNFVLAAALEKEDQAGTGAGGSPAAVEAGAAGGGGPGFAPAGGRGGGGEGRGDESLIGRERTREAAVLYVRPSCRVGIASLSSVALSHRPQHKVDREQCGARFAQLLTGGRSPLRGVQVGAGEGPPPRPNRPQVSDCERLRQAAAQLAAGVWDPT